MKFTELTKKQQKAVIAEVAKAFIENGETEADAIECAKEYVRDCDFRLVDYSPDEDGSDIRVEY